MQASSFWQRFSGVAESGDLDDLRRDMVVEISVALAVVGWLLFVASIRYDGRLEGLPAALILLTGGMASISLRTQRIRLALHGLIVTPILAIACYKLAFPESLAQYYFPVAVVISSLLISHLSVFVVASLASVLCLAVARWHGAGWLDSEQIITPTMLTYVTALAAWLGSRQLHIALGWLQSSYKRASDLLEELRSERGSLARTLKALEDAYVRIEKMNYALIEARSAAEEARRLKAEFAANVSHELRTPLNIIIGFSETLANAPETYPGVTWTPTLRGDIEHIYQSSRHLSSLIDDILDLSALDARQVGLAVEETAIQDVIAEAVAVVQDLFRAKRLYLNVQVEPDLPRLRIDASRIRQVLINLLTNASRFTSQGGVTITARIVGDEVQVAVADTGIGIAPQDVPKVFEDFAQVDGSASRKHEGTGLGVPISRRLVQLHGGRMWLRSQPGEGTTFFFTLPISEQRRPERGRRPGSTDGPTLSYRKTVLMIEPDPLLLRTVRRHLSSYDVIDVSNPGDLPMLIDHHNPIALLVDQQEDEQVGHDGWLAQVPPDLPVITVALPGSLRRAKALGIQNYLIKPVLREQLLDAIACLEQRVHNVLVVDDEPQVVELISRMLQSAGEEFHPIKAYGGAEALARLRHDRVDLVLLDLIMPDVSGLAVLQEMKGDPALAGIPVIVVSAQDTDAARPRGGLFLNVARSDSPSISETLSVLQSLVGALPVRGLPTPAHEQESPAAPVGPPVS